MVEVFNY